MASQLKFPVLKKVEYIDLIKNKETVLTVDGKNVEGMTWRKFQIYLGERLPKGNYNYILKIKGDNAINKGIIKTVGGLQVKDQETTSETQKLETQILLLSKKVESFNEGNSIPMSMLIEVTKQSYESRIKYLDIEVSRRESTITKLETSIEVLNVKLLDSDDLVKELEGKTGLSQYIQLAQDFAKIKFGAPAPVTNLQASESSDIPQEIITILGIVAWDQVQPEVINSITEAMKIYINKLPLKEG
jgi:hypothetical protein